MLVMAIALTRMQLSQLWKVYGQYKAGITVIFNSLDSSLVPVNSWYRHRYPDTAPNRRLTGTRAKRAKKSCIFAFDWYTVVGNTFVIDELAAYQCLSPFDTELVTPGRFEVWMWGFCLFYWCPASKIRLERRFVFLEELLRKNCAVRG